MEIEPTRNGELHGKCRGFNRGDWRNGETLGFYRTLKISQSGKMKISRTNSEMQPTKQPNEIESTSPR